MKYKAREIPDGGLSIDTEVTAAGIGLVDEDFQCRGPLHIRGTLKKADEAVIARLEITAVYEFRCNYCAEMFSREQTVPMTLYFEIHSPEDVIDVGEEIRQELIVDFSPLSRTGKEERADVCPGCSGNIDNLKEKYHIIDENEDSGGTRLPL